MAQHWPSELATLHSPCITIVVAGVPFTQLLDKESVEYAINIVDHASEPMAGAVITVRQLLQFVQTFIMQMRVSQAQAQAANE